ncbi:MAG TPA: amidohydrolase family protein, partial [Pseudoxanthomonas sp.]|nr:amidohydrolase family protein [Pseudoxanthomonas sp.]
MWRIFFGLVLAVGAIEASTAETAITVLTAGRIHTSNPEQPQVQAIAWDGSGRLLATGNAQELHSRYPQATRIDKPDATVIPGLIDAHGHVMGLGYALMRADLTGTRSKDEAIARLRDYEKQLPAGA